MKVALFSDTFNPQINGVTNTLEKLLKYFEEKNIEYINFVPKYDENDFDSHTERFYSLKFFLYPECRLALPNLFRVSQVLSKFKPDIIHIMTEFNMGITGLNFGRKHNIPTISNYTTNFYEYTKYYNLEFLKQPIWDYMKWFHNQNSITLCPSTETKNMLHSNGIERLGVFSRGIDSQKFNPYYRNNNLRKQLGIEDKTVFLYVGRVSIEKDLDVLSDGYKIIREKYKNKIALVITGEGPHLEKCKKIFPKDTIYTGFKKGKELAEIYASSDIFVCPSSTETFGNVVLEAMTSGIPVIGADAGGIKEIIQHKYNGLKFKTRDTEELVQCMATLIENKRLNQQIRQNGIVFGRNRSWNKIFDELLGIYYSLLDKTNPAGFRISLYSSVR